MAQRRLENDTRITLSVFDRLIDLDPKSSQEGGKLPPSSLRELKNSVRRDLEWLLNARRTPQPIDPGLEETNKSVVIYGLPDFTGISVKNLSEQKRMQKEIERAIKLFEPHLINLRVTLEPTASTERVIKFRIQAQLDVDPAPEPVAFDTVLELGSGQFGIKEA